MATKKKAWTDLLGTGGTSDTAGDTGTADNGPKEPPATVLMHTIVSNPENPRPDEDYTDADPEFRELKATLKEIGQLQPLAVVSRSVYEQAKPNVVEQLKPKERAQFRKADWVVVTGNRRLAAARQLGWTRIDIRVQDQLGDEDGRIDDAVVIENIHRKNIAPIREAEFLKRMVAKHGSQEKVAERIGKTQVYVSQRLSLLNLAPDIQDQVDTGELKLKDARLLASQTEDPAEQRARVAEIKRKAAEPKPPRKRRTVQNPVLDEEQAESDMSNASPANGQPVLTTDEVEPAVTEHEQPDNAAGQPSVPEQASHPVETTTGGREQQPKLFPYKDGVEAAQYLILKMPPDEFTKMLDLLIRHRDEQAVSAG
ncbi:ParB/RepB/Spo0J family partition protein [Streptomyces sp. NPDC020597]|uniref:ParB/RepB/Spo0J family partition protein n=1 Tax=unclassified Streptomyces TaxID=2593676 RepID=UPI0037A0F184